MAPSFMHILIVVLVVVLLFGRGKISDIMGEFAKGIKSFKQGLSDDDEKAAPDHKTIDERPVDKIDARSTAKENIRAG